MKRLLLTAGITAALVTGTSGGTRADVTAWGPGQVVVDDSQPGRLVGRASDEKTGEAISELVLELLHPALADGRSFPEPWVAQGNAARAHAVAQVITANDGSFRFEGLSVGRYLVRPKSPHLNSFAQAASISLQDPVATILMSVDLGRSISGTVVDANGQALAGFFVFLSGVDPGDGSNAQNPNETAPWTQSGQDGHFTLVRLPDGILHVQAARQEFGFSAPLQVKPGSEQQALKATVPDERRLLDPNAQTAGIGVSLHFSPLGPKLARLGASMPAAEAGLLPGDLVHTVDGRPTRFMTPVEFVSRCRGVAGSTVTLGVERDGQNHEFQIRRIPLENPPR